MTHINDHASYQGGDAYGNRRYHDVTEGRSGCPFFKKVPPGKTPQHSTSSANGGAGHWRGRSLRIHLLLQPSGCAAGQVASPGLGFLICGMGTMAARPSHAAVRRAGGRQGLRAGPSTQEVLELLVVVVTATSHFSMLPSVPLCVNLC